MADNRTDLETSANSTNTDPRPRNLYEKRFTLPIDEIARRNLETFRKTYYQLEPEHPEFVGMTLFGSMVKGRQLNPAILTLFFLSTLIKPRIN